MEFDPHLSTGRMNSMLMRDQGVSAKYGVFVIGSCEEVCRFGGG